MMGDIYLINDTICDVPVRRHEMHSSKEGDRSVIFPSGFCAARHIIQHQ